MALRYRRCFRRHGPIPGFDFAIDSKWCAPTKETRPFKEDSTITLWMIGPLIFCTGGYTLYKWGGFVHRPDRDPIFRRNVVRLLNDYEARLNDEARNRAL